MTTRYVLDFNKARAVPEVQENFHAYLKRSYNIEPLEFLIAVDNFKKETDIKTKVQTAKQIADKFAKEGGELELNIDIFTRRQILTNAAVLDTNTDNLDTIFDESYKVISAELKSDSFARYIDSVMFKEFSSKKGAKFMTELLPQDFKLKTITFSPFNVVGTVQNEDVVSLLRMVEDISDWTALNITKKHDRAKDYYSYISKSKYVLDGQCPDQLAAKFVGLLPVSAEHALYVLIDREYRPKWEPFVKYQSECPPHKGEDVDYMQLVSYAEIKLMSFMQTRFTCGNTTVMYDTERRCYILISKTTTGVDHVPLMKKKHALPICVVSIYAIYKISETKCRYVALSHQWFNMKDVSGFLLKSLLKKRGKKLFEEWSKLAKERVAKYGDDRPKYCPEMDTLDAFNAKYLPNPDSVKTWITD